MADFTGCPQRMHAVEGNMEMQSSGSKLSYKFQRLREQLRQAIDAGELRGMLPGERVLAKQFGANAKTLSKALTDLAAEGVLERGIGRGTWVRGSSNSTSQDSSGWLIICAPEQTELTVIRRIIDAHPNTRVITDAGELRPSFLNQFSAVVDFSAAGTSEAQLRGYLVRGMNVVLVDRESGVYLMNSVEVDRTLGVTRLARDLMLGGHRRFFAVERTGHTEVADAIRLAGQRYAPDAVVDSGLAGDVQAALDTGHTAFICETRQAAVSVRQALDDRAIAIPRQVSLAAVGAGLEEYPCSGYYVHAREKADAIIGLLRNSQLKRPTTVWLAGTYVDRGTTGPVQRGAAAAEQWNSIPA